MITQFSQTNLRIIATLSRIIYRETGNMQLACAIGSWGDTQSDEDILEMLQDEEEKPSINLPLN